MTQRLGVLVFALLGALVFGGCAMEGGDGLGESADGLRIDCSYVKCAMPICEEGQHAEQRGNACCLECVNDRPAPRNDRCATVLCAAVACAEGEVAVTSQGQCCPSCRPVGPTAECATDLDCPEINCFACPCPVSECDRGSCVTWTPDESTCGAY